MNSFDPSASEQDIAQDVPSTFSQAKHAVQAATRETVSDIKQASRETAQQLKGHAADLAENRKTNLADKISGYGAAVNKSAESLEQQDPNIAWLTHQVADRLNGAADYVRTRDLNQLKSDAADVIRRNPVLVLGGLFAIGLIAGNFLKASPGKTARSDSRSLLRDRYPEREEVERSDGEVFSDWPEVPPSESIK